jgi:hypothetical protein
MLVKMKWKRNIKARDASVGFSRFLLKGWILASEYSLPLFMRLLQHVTFPHCHFLLRWRRELGEAEFTIT